MAKFVVLFEDVSEGAVSIRQTVLPRHLEFLAANSTRITAAGPLMTPADEGAGGLWLVDAETADEVDDLVRQDPFWPAGLRLSVRILVWKQVFAAGALVGS